MNLDIPDTWAALDLGEVLDYGKTRKAEPKDIPDDAWLLELEDIEKDTSKVLQRLTFAQRKSKSTKNRFEKGDVLYGKLRPYLNKVVLADAPGFCSTEIVPISGNIAVNSRYLFHWLRHPAFLDYVSSVSHGLNMPRLGTDAGNKAPLVLAPVAEQERIADKLDTVLARVNTVNDRLARVAPILKRFRQSVLAAATSGALTADWRGDQRLPKKEWPEEVLTDGVVSFANGISKRSGTSGSETTVLRLADFKNSLRIRGNERTIRLMPNEIEKFKLENGDLLVVRVNGSVELTGKFILYEQLIDKVECYCDHFIRIRINADKFDPNFVVAVANAGAGRDHIENGLVTSAGQNTVNQGVLGSMPIPRPSLDEQKEIVRRVELLFAYADRLEARLQAAQTAAQRLTPALLAKAFRGELVPQDPNDEPATDLLRRLKASGSAPKVSTKKGRGSKAKPA